MQKQDKGQKGFTLIEILVVIGIVAILATIVLIAINPARQFAQSRNSQRISNVNTILNAIGQRIADKKGLFPAETGCAAITAGTVYTIGTGGVGVVNPPATAFIDMSCLVPTYIASSLPVDPTDGVWTSPTAYNTRYNVMQDALGRFTVSAPDSIAEPSLPSTTSVSVTR